MISASKRLLYGTLLVVAGAIVITAKAQQSAVAPTPPMGWNSWDSYGLTITEQQFRDNVTVQKQKLLPFGWRYAVIDEGWFFENPQDRETPDKLHYAIDSHGRYVPVPARFPSAVNGAAASPQPASTGKLPATVEETNFTEIGRWVHAQGLKFGIHIVRGIPRVSVERSLPIEGSRFSTQDAADTSDSCPWDPTNWGVRDNAAGQAWYDSLLRQYASWGVDLLKVDCISDHPYKVDEIRMIRRAIDKTGRPIVLSLSPGPTQLAHAQEVGSLAAMWRISDDIWDVWAKPSQDFPQTIQSQFARLAAWACYTRPGNWPDADMLPLGELRPSPGWGAPRHSQLTPDEQRTQLTLWAIARSPLILGANLTMLDEPILALLTNREVIAIDQTATESSEVLHEGVTIAWRASLPQGKVALAIFNTGDTPLKIDRKFADFGSSFGKRKWSVRNVWDAKESGRADSITQELAPHTCVLLVLR